MDANTARSPRRSPDQWAQIIEQQKNSGLSVGKFCKKQRIGYVSFCKWQKRLAESPVGHQEPAAFIDLSQLSASSTSGHWNIVLRLGNGVELSLSQQ